MEQVYVTISTLTFAKRTRYLKKLQKGLGLNIYNLGTGKVILSLKLSKYGKAVGHYSLLLLLNAAQDTAACYSDPAKAKEELGWGITEMSKMHGVSHQMDLKTNHLIKREEVIPLF